MVEDQVLHRVLHQMMREAYQEKLQAEQICPHLQWEVVLEILAAAVRAPAAVRASEAVEVQVQVLPALEVLEQRLLVDVKVVEEEDPFYCHHSHQCSED